MKLLVVIPPSPFLINPVAFPPLGALYVASAAEEIGVEVKISDTSWQELPDWDPDFIGVSASTPHIPSLLSLMERLRWYEAPIIMGGPHFDIKPMDYLLLGADAVSKGDGEATIVEFIRDRRGIIEGRCDDWPLPARHLIDIHRYEYALGGTPTTSMMTSRGCPFRCAYCCKTSLGKEVRFNPIEKVRKEVQAIKKLGFGGVMLYDDELNLIPKRFQALCSIMKEEGVRWRGFVRSNLFNETQAKLMAESGCYEVCSGVESGSDLILRNVNKGATVADGSRTRDLCKQYGLRFKSFMIIGLPGETEDTVRETEEWLLSTRPEDFDLCPFTPYPGSPLMDDPRKFGVNILDNYWHTEYYHKGIPGRYRSHTCTNGLSAERIEELRDSIERRVRAELS